MSVRVLLMAFALSPMMGHAATQTIATCQVKGDGSVNEFKILVDSASDPRAWDGPGVPIALVETKAADVNPINSLDQIPGAVHLIAARDGERLVAAGKVELPSLSFGKRRPKIAHVSLVVTLGLPSSGIKPINQLLYVVDGQTTAKQLVCRDIRD